MEVLQAVAKLTCSDIANRGIHSFIQYVCTLQYATLNLARPTVLENLGSVPPDEAGETRGFGGASVGNEAVLTWRSKLEKVKG